MMTQVLYTPLHIAVRFGTLDVVQYMIEEQQCDVECRDKYADTPLHTAALGGRLDIVQYLISERGCDPMSRGQYGRTPLHDACQTGRLDVVKYLMEDVKVDSSCRDENDDVTPLHIAAICGRLSMVKVLVEDYLCDPGVKDRNGQTPADWAQRKGHTHIISYLSSIEKTVSSECDYYCGVSKPLLCVMLSVESMMIIIIMVLCWHWLLLVACVPGCNPGVIDDECLPAMYMFPYV